MRNLTKSLLLLIHWMAFLSCSSNQNNPKNQVALHPIKKPTCESAGVTPQLKKGIYAQLGADDGDAICGCDPGYMLDFATGDCYAVGYLECSQYPQSVCEQAGCVWDQNNCMSLSASHCANLNRADCEKDASSCLWFGKDDKGSCKYTSGACSASGESTCKEAYTCSWFPSSGSCVSLIAACDVVTESTSCNSTQTCYWNDNTCKPAFVSCASFDQNACAASRWCLWDEAANACLSSTVSACSDAKTTNVCGKLKGCVWDENSFGVGTCLSKYVSDCVEATQDTTCESLYGCFWNTGTGQCRSKLTSSCEPQEAESDCKKIVGCFWDSEGSKCISKYTGSCSAATSSTACDQVLGCFWNTNTCVSKTLTACTTIAAKSDCIGTCLWDDDDKKCLSKVTSACSTASGSTACGSLTGCLWDSSSNTCLSKAVSGCSLAGDSNTCGSLSLCTWDSGTNKCISAWSCDGAGETSCKASTTCGWSASKNCVSRLWCWWYGDCWQG